MKGEASVFAGSVTSKLMGKLSAVLPDSIAGKSHKPMTRPGLGQGSAPRRLSPAGRIPRRVIAAVAAVHARTGTRRAAFISQHHRQREDDLGLVLRHPVGDRAGRGLRRDQERHREACSGRSSASARSPGATVWTTMPRGPEAAAQRLEQVDQRRLGRAVGLRTRAGRGSRRPTRCRRSGRAPRRASSGRRPRGRARCPSGWSAAGRRTPRCPTAPARNRDQVPALSTATSRPPSAARTAAPAATVAARSVTSTGSTCIRPAATSRSFSAFRALIATDAPRSASSRASAAPIPLDAPVTQTRAPSICTLRPPRRGCGPGRAG